MEEKIYHLITYDVYTSEIIEILNFHKRENAIIAGEKYIKDLYTEQREDFQCSLEELYEYWKETGSFYGQIELAESEFED